VGQKVLTKPLAKRGGRCWLEDKGVEHVEHVGSSATEF